MGQKAPQKAPSPRRIYPNTRKAISDLFRLVVEKRKNPKIDMKKEYLKRFSDKYIVDSIKDLREQMLPKFEELKKLGAFDGDVSEYFTAHDIAIQLQSSPDDTLSKELGDATTKAEFVPNNRGKRLYLLSALIYRYEELIKKVHDERKSMIKKKMRKKRKKETE